MADHSTNRPYRQIDPRKIVETIDLLSKRIAERFPESGLSKVVGELDLIASESVARTEWIQRPILPLRIGAGLLVVVILVLIGWLVTSLNRPDMKDTANFIQFIEASIGSVVFIGATILFLINCETRIKRQRALKAIHELRSLAHIVDMHQLTKDPDRYLLGGSLTASSPKRTMTPFELGRYLDYCSEILSLISKIAALYVQGLEDQVILDAVDEIEDLTAGLSRKIWQKITILDSITSRTQSATKTG
jgi:hypothetical protein